MPTPDDSGPHHPPAPADPLSSTPEPPTPAVDVTPAPRTATPTKRSPARRALRIAGIATAFVIGLPALGILLLYIVATIRSPIHRAATDPVWDEPTHAERVAAKRHQLVVEATEAGLAACAKQEWSTCTVRLSQAQYDEPDVAKDPRVIEAWKAFNVAADKAKLENSAGW